MAQLCCWQAQLGSFLAPTTLPAALRKSSPKPGTYAKLPPVSAAGSCPPRGNPACCNIGGTSSVDHPGKDRWPQRPGFRVTSRAATRSKTRPRSLPMRGSSLYAVQMFRERRGAGDGTSRGRWYKPIRQVTHPTTLRRHLERGKKLLRLEAADKNVDQVHAVGRR